MRESYEPGPGNKWRICCIGEIERNQKRYTEGKYDNTIDRHLFIIQVSSNILGGWTTLYTTNPTMMPFNFTDTNALSPQEFYRILIGP